MYVWGVKLIMPGLRLSEALVIEGIRIEAGPLDSRGRPQSRFYVRLVYDECVFDDRVESDAFRRIEDLTTAASLVAGVGPPFVESLLLENREELQAAKRPTPISLTVGLPIESGVPLLEPARLEHAYETIRQLQPADRHTFQRALRWIRRRYDEDDAYDRFLSTWIGFNTLYGPHGPGREQSRIRRFIEDTFTTEEASKSILNQGFDAASLDLLAGSGLLLRQKKNEVNISEELHKRLEAHRASGVGAKELLVTLALTLYAFRNTLVHGAQHGDHDRREISMLHAATGILVSLMYRALRARAAL